MTYFTGLARVARATGYPVIEVDGWEGRGHGHMGAVRTIVCHHTAGSSTGNYPSLNVVAYGRTGLKGPLSHYGIGRDGTIYVIAAGLCAHAGKDSQLAPAHRNHCAIGIEAENTGLGERWPDKQLDAYVKLCRALIDEFGLSANDVLGHKEIAPRRKIDPNFSANGFDMADFRAAVRRGYWTKPTTKPAGTIKPAAAPAPAIPAEPKPAPQEDIDMQLFKLGGAKYRLLSGTAYRGVSKSLAEKMIKAGHKVVAVTAEENAELSRNFNGTPDLVEVVK
ncbi:hypothetical protein GCM10022377_10350 [Zhihengliuella alba]|uniref:N-acetylmuramoyl-L-alanine amidase n=1 Tax=Zhihengliuella alba TaxID=547018 RepID=A0ABP7D0S3_9MICC